MVVPSRKRSQHSILHGKRGSRSRSKRSNAKHAPYLIRSPSDAAQRSAVAHRQAKHVAGANLESSVSLEEGREGRRGLFFHTQNSCEGLIYL